MRYVVSYDLNNPGQNYSALIDYLESLGAQKILKSQWAVRIKSTNANFIVASLVPFIDSNDRVLVTCLDSDDWASWNLMFDLSDL